ncbi:argininosuccinate lyase [Erythrobacter sp. YT30]|uniref:argininosuccinate lyase n=1 Tax=Erythrobacter sp. YT30 TaxID=1735012 RepID=UPI00076C7546|nr:argininosuccinate lyase [Erythrobacter sp. YT30]KWV90452.1 argininosuccinate lyase [Erythrobacter sp. YT30]
MRTAFTILALITGTAALAACGSRQQLEPLEGSSLPVAPAGATTPPTSEELLELDALAAPQRSVELRRRSEEREDDPFDLPPE